MNDKGRTKLALCSHHIKNGSSNNHQWIIYVGENCDKELVICMFINCFPPKNAYWLQREKKQYKYDEEIKQYLDRLIRINITSGER